MRPSRTSEWLVVAAVVAATLLFVGCTSEATGPPNRLAFADPGSVPTPTPEPSAVDSIPESPVDEPTIGDSQQHESVLPAGAVPPVRGAAAELVVGDRWSVPVQVACNLGWITDGGQRSWRAEVDNFATPTAWTEAADENGQLTLIAELEGADVAVFRAADAADGADEVRYRRTPASISC